MCVFKINGDHFKICLMVVGYILGSLMVVDTFLANCDGKSVEELWLSFHSQMMILQEKPIPSKMSKPQTSMPWINWDLKKKIRRNNHLIKSRKKSQMHRSNFLKNGHNLQKQIRQARWDHINGIIT